MGAAQPDQQQSTFAMPKRHKYQITKANIGTLFHLRIRKQMILSQILFKMQISKMQDRATIYSITLILQLILNWTRIFYLRSRFRSKKLKLKQLATKCQ